MTYIKFFLATIILSSLTLGANAKEGMWLPMLIEKLNIQEMHSLGFKLNAEDIYSVNQACMKDAVMLFNRGCTAELISEKGLILTNHHCGMKQIQSHSSLENDYLTNGFWANNLHEELSNPGLTVAILRFMQDITDEVLEGTTIQMPEFQRKAIIKANIDSIQDEYQKTDFIKAQVSPFYFGNQYVLFVSDIYKDVRLVGAPPSAVGKFGGDTDNWMWPRHGGDFSIFRIYANKNNEPSEYSDDNIPYKPKYVLPISIGGIKENDFTMVFGYPGSTKQYATSHLIKSMRDYSYPKLIHVRESKLKVINQAMNSQQALRIKYAAKAASVSNSWKRWIGELKGFKRFDVIAKKEAEEAQLTAWLEQNNHEQSQILEQLKKLYQQYSEVNLASSLSSEFIFRNGIEILTLSEKTLRYDFTKQEDKDKYANEVSKMFKDYDVSTDKYLMAELLPLYFSYMPTSYQSKEMQQIYKKAKQDPAKCTAKVFKHSIFQNQSKLEALLKKDPKVIKKKIAKDPAYKLSSDLSKIYYKEVKPELSKINYRIDSLNRIYVRLLTAYDSSITAYPEANLTLRLAYGKVASYQPKDAVNYQFSTTLKGIMEKDNPDIYDYRVPKRLKELYEAKDYGNYANEDGTLPVCFIATNHTTGGNSGSPVLNANGELIGLNFDRAWDGVMSDFYYTPEICRNISVDIRYVLFIIDKFAGAGYLIDEMNIVNER